MAVHPPPRSRPRFATLDELDAAILGARRMGLRLSYVLGPFNEAAARENLRCAQLPDHEAALLARLLEIAAKAGKRSFRLDPSTLRGWHPAGGDPAAALDRLHKGRWFWRVAGQTRDGVWLPDGYHLTFDLVPGRTAKTAREARDEAGAVLGLMRSPDAKPTDCPVLGAFARAAGMAPPRRTRVGAAEEHRRALRMIDWAVRSCIPVYFEAIRRDDLARQIKMLPEVRTRETARGVVAQAAEVSQSSRVQALARYYMRASQAGASDRDRGLEDSAAAAFAGALAAGAERALGRDLRDDAARLLFELALEGWEGGERGPTSRRPPPRRHSADEPSEDIPATSRRRA